MRRVSKIKDGKKMTADDYKQIAVTGLNMARIPVASFALPEFIQPNSEYDEDMLLGLSAAILTALVTFCLATMKPK